MPIRWNDPLYSIAVPRLSLPPGSGSILAIATGIVEHCCDSESIVLRIDFGGIPPRQG